MTLGERIDGLRVMLDLSVTDLAKLSGLSRGFVHLIISNQSDPTFSSLVKLAHALDIPVADMIAPVDGQSGWESQSHSAPLPFD